MVLNRPMKTEAIRGGGPMRQLRRAPLDGAMVRC